MKVSAVQQDLTSDGSEFQVCGATTENTSRESHIRVQLVSVVSLTSDACAVLREVVIFSYS